MRSFMSALQRAHSGAWASRRDLGFCSGVTYVRHSSAEAVPCVQRASSRSASSTSTPPAVARRPHFFWRDTFGEIENGTRRATSPAFANLQAVLKRFSGICLRRKESAVSATKFSCTSTMRRFLFFSASCPAVPMTSSICAWTDQRAPKRLVPTADNRAAQRRAPPGRG
jgi:hypothetical protein